MSDDAGALLRARAAVLDALRTEFDPVDQGDSEFQPLMPPDIKPSPPMPLRPEFPGFEFSTDSPEVKEWQRQVEEWNRECDAWRRETNEARDEWAQEYEDYLTRSSQERTEQQRRLFKRAEAHVARVKQAVDELLQLVDRVEPTEWERAVASLHHDGNYSVVLTDPDDHETVSVLLMLHSGTTKAGATEVVKKVQHVGPETIVTGVALDDAIEIRNDFSAYATVRIKEGTRRSSGSREPIPESVRREVWRRDQGACVDCGSRERLEFDHIIPVSQGGSNTARNIELRCESCNRRKAASI